MHDRVAVGLLLVGTVGLFGAVEAEAQSAWTDRGYLNINGAYQTGGTTFSQSLTEMIYGEEATYSLSHDFGTGAMFDVGAGGRIWRNLAVGLAVSSFNTTSTVELSGSAPHPLFFNRPRSVSHRLDELDHRQIGYHVQLSWFVPVADRVDVAVFGGPSFYDVQQQLGTGVTLTETEPFDTVAVSRLVTAEQSENGVGANVGVDVTFLVTDVVGVGVMLRWAGASVDFETAGGTQSVDVGGVQVGGGVRIRF